MEIDWKNNNYFKTENFNILSFEETKEIIVESIATFFKKDCSYLQRRASLLILEIFIRDFNILKKELLSIPVGEVMDRNDPKVKEWTRKVLAKGKCEICGSTKQLEAHHIEYWSLCPEKRIDVKNGRCLCLKCHAKMHKGEKAEKLILSKELVVT